jgi:hypothetical protein
VHGVPSEIAEEVLVLFEDENPATSSGKQEPGHHSSGPAANDDQVEGLLKVTKVAG